MSAFEYFDSPWDWVDYGVNLVMRIFVGSIVLGFFPNMVVTIIVLYWIFKKLVSDSWPYTWGRLFKK